MSASKRIEIERAAAGWLARRDGEGWTPADADALARWLDVDVAHRVAFLRLEAAWREAGRLQALGAGWKAADPPPRGHWHAASRETGLPPDADPLPTPPDLSGLRFAPRPRHAASARRAMAAAAFLIVLGAASLAGWGLRTQTHVEATRYATTLGGLRTLSLADGSTTTLASDSQIDVRLSRRDRHIGLARGEAFFDVAKDARRPFVVDAGSREVVAVGTRFSVRRDPHEVRVIVTEGLVRLQSPAREGARMPAAMLPAGSVALVRGDAVLVRSVAVTDAERMLDWRAGLLVFSDTTLADAAAEFNRYNARKIVVADAQAGALRVGGSFRWDNADGFVRLLERGFPVRAEYADDRIVLASR